MARMVVFYSTPVKGRVAYRIDDLETRLPYSRLMPNVVKIHEGKTPQRIHYLTEWAERRGMTQADIVRLLGVNKGTVSKWFGGALPQESNILALAEIFAIEPTQLFRHPDDDWLAQLFRDRSEEERRRMIATIEAAFPRSDRVAN